MKVLSCLLRRAREVLFGFKVNGRTREGMGVSHLLFVNNSLVFCEAFLAHMIYLSWLLMWFEAISSLKINLIKSELILVGKVENLEELAFKLGYKLGMLPITYLGLPLCVPHNSLVAWDGVEERFHKRLAMWKRHYISKGGRLTLIKSMLSCLPNYFMSLF